MSVIDHSEQQSSLRVSLQCATDLATDVATGQCPDETELQAWVAAALAGARREIDAPLVVTVRIVGEAESAALNGGFRSKDGPTNVLAFPASPPLIPADELDEQELGDLVICLPVAAREAGQQGKTLVHHLAHLTVHGALHLLGYDHLNEAEAEAMEGLERDVMAQLGLPDPYADS